MKFGIAQIDCKVGDVEANCRTIGSMIGRAAGAGCDVVVLPEMSDTGYDMEAISAHASAWDSGPCRMLQDLAAKHAITVICGLSEREEDRLYNAVALIGDDGKLIAKYRKVHLFSAGPIMEHHHLSAGDWLTLVSIGDFKVGVMVCYDLRFPEMARALVLGGAEILVVPSAWPFPRLEHFKTFTTCRAMEGQVYVAAANRVGTDGRSTFCGTSRLIDPYGTPLVCASEVEKTLIVGEIDRSRLERTRSAMDTLRDRREDVYQTPPK